MLQWHKKLEEKGGWKASSFVNLIYNWDKERKVKNLMTQEPLVMGPPKKTTRVWVK